ncbi:MAG TPA: GNAT family N-acetyltransferase [Mycobacteriales bacterium]|nr:GNAT family N-acetyltransferase [Mycobacteriales bacterium]
MSIDLVAAGAANHRSMFAAEARAQGGVAETRYGGIFTYGDGLEAQVAFPDVPVAEEAAFADHVVATVRSCRDVREVGWWLLDESRSASLGPKLLARGFSWGWRPNWMALDVGKLVEDLPVPAAVDIVPTPNGFAAMRGGAKIGSIRYHLDGGPAGGIYATAVDPAHRRHGIGTALTVAAVRALAGHGCRHVLLNATALGEPAYRRAGFELIGESGQTWWLPGHRLTTPPPSETEIAFVEAIGAGDLGTAAGTRPRDLDAALAAEETPLDIAAITGQAESARWLIEHGATFDLARRLHRAALVKLLERRVTT